LDQTGAEQLLGKGDMLFFPSDYPKPARVQAPYVSNSEMRNLIDYLKNQGIEPDYDTSVVELPATTLPDAVTNPDDRDEFYNIAKEYIISAQRASASLLQTRLSIGFNRATRLLQQLEDGGVVGPANGAKARSVLIKGNSDLAGAFADGLDNEEDNSDSFESNEEQKEN
jgi:S-DNA-T family DNA segregation ATPase FtsK/SpoIIIE